MAEAAYTIPPQPPISLPLVHIGTTVELCGLKAKPELNGTLATILGFDTSSGRYMVSLWSEGTSIKLKPENVTAAVL